ncbi:MAG: HAMP domain-containing histidine kinase [Ruminococcaceae bacterium]|nr:HAMP domain-containing histidine kinase [Oscillospiraceae bacterium]
MRKFSHKLSVKTASVLVSILSLVLIISFILGMSIASQSNSNSPESITTAFIENYLGSSDELYNECNTILQHHLNDTLNVYNNSSDNLYTISLFDRVIASTYNGEGDYLAYSTTISSFSNVSGRYIYDFNVTVYYPSNSFFNLELVNRLSNLYYTLFISLIIFSIIFVASLAILLNGAGHRDDSKTITLRTIDKLPFDIHTIALALIAILQFSLYFNNFQSDTYRFFNCCSFFLIDYLLILNYLVSFTNLLKAKELIKRCIIYPIILGIGRFIKKFIMIIAKVISQLPFVWKTVLALITWSLIELFIIHNTQNNLNNFILYWSISKAVIIPFVIAVSLMLRKIQKSGKKIADGEIEYRLDTKHMFGDFKEFGETLNGISEGMGRAVEDKLKSERFKTELITNVSHDIKTPLTSIINYVDLIKKEKPENESVKQYVDVLDRQSSRLKKLIEDLIEASKASTGNLKVTLVPCDLNVLLTQIIGEYEDSMRARALELVVDCPDHATMISADSRHLWRVIDNLINNIRKYAMEGTRVYITLTADETKAYIIFKNISKSPLNITSDELMERFTRGDSSRNTEGSGLGLSIAKSLTEIQNGIFSLDIDGDLFKATLTFDLLK